MMQALTLAYVALVLHGASVCASYAFYVGSSLTQSGNILVGGTGEEVSSHWLQIFPAADHQAGETITVGVTREAVLPGDLIEIPQVNHTFRYISMEYSDYWGLPAPLTNGGLNENGVTVRDVWAPNREELLQMTPNPQTGINYANLARIVMERAHSALHGVEIIGDLIQKYGYATYGGNTHLIADKNEGWVVWEFAGGKGLWAAERLKHDEVRVLYPGYIEDFPMDFMKNPDYMGSENLVSFAVEQGWWDFSSEEAFNIVNVYGLRNDQSNPVGGGEGWISQTQLEEETAAMAPVTERDLIQRVRDPRISTDEAGYGQVITLWKDLDIDLWHVWNAPTSSIAAPFVPWWLGVQSVPPEFGQHRYLTKGASSTFLNPDFIMQEGSRFACRLFKRVLFYMCSIPNFFHPLVNEMFLGFENRSRSDFEWVEGTGKMLLSRGRRDLLYHLLTHYSHSRANEALQMGESILTAMEAYIRATERRQDPVGVNINAQPGETTVRCVLNAWVSSSQDSHGHAQHPMQFEPIGNDNVSQYEKIPPGLSYQ